MIYVCKNVFFMIKRDQPRGKDAPEYGDSTFSSQHYRRYE